MSWGLTADALGSCTGFQMLLLPVPQPHICRSRMRINEEALARMTMTVSFNIHHQGGGASASPLCGTRADRSGLREAAWCGREVIFSSGHERYCCVCNPRSSPQGQTAMWHQQPHCCLMCSNADGKENRQGTFSHYFAVLKMIYINSKFTYIGEKNTNKSTDLIIKHMQNP